MFSGLWVCCAGLDACADRRCVDLWLDMDYCRCSPENRGGNAALSNTAGVVAAYHKYGVSPDKLGIVFPWFG